MPNPYLSQSANDIATNLTQNWQQNALPSINSGAQLAGGFGGSRQGVAQALSANGLNQAIGQAQNSLYSNAYNTDQQIASQQAMQAAQIASNEKLGAMQNQTQRDLGFGNLGLGYTQAGQNYTLGLGGLANTAQSNANQYALGMGNLGLGYTQAGNSYALGQQQNANQAQANANNYALGLGQNANTAQANQNQYNLGLGNLGLGYTQAGNNYNLGLGQLGLGQQQADTSQYNAETNRGLGYGQLAQTGDQNAFNNQLQGFNAQLQALNALQGWNNNGINWANTQQQTPLQNLGQLANMGAGIGSGYGSTSQPGYGALQGALAGGLTMAQILNLLSKPGG